ncbi:MAG: zinc ribbon domain-containing protein [Candidatus Rokubacteria bacterium]|nr:zinc ribbon domain-containing protein [Candidatus Rokubacteria bacterium]MBI3826972.1 zinc ribbon domain-containing protein [Candidatus Rokubacteria bacterium]
MPTYEYFCPTCNQAVTLQMPMSQHDRGEAACPQCGGHELRPQVGTFFAKTSRKS